VEGEQQRERTRRERTAREQRKRMLILLSGTVAGLATAGFGIGLTSPPFSTLLVVWGVIYIAAALAFVFYRSPLFPAPEAVEPQVGLVDSARNSVSDVRVLDQIAIRLARSGPVDPWSLLRDPNAQIRYLGTRLLFSITDRIDDWELVKPRQISIFLRDEVWLEVQKVLLSALAAIGQPRGAADIANPPPSTDAPVTPVPSHAALEVATSLVDYLSWASDAEAVYIVDALARIGFLSRRFGLLSIVREEEVDAFPTAQRALVSANLLRRQPYVVVHALLSGVLATGYDSQSVARIEGLPIEFALTLAGSEYPMTSEVAQLSQQFLRHQSGTTDYLSIVQSPELSGLRPQAVQELMEFFGLSDERSLGYYDDLRQSSYYKSIYQFLLQIRLAMAELQVTRGQK
jgi:hypothetical protein